MAINLRRSDSPEERDSTPPPVRNLQSWLAQINSMVYGAGGLFLIYQYWAHVRRQVILVAGLIFIIYGSYRFFLVRRAQRR